ncbi:MAG: NRDE family protein [Novosphingobium sp.]|nr:NRDE family protein [Novosphingobium sp.]
MCVAAIAWMAHPRWRLVAIGNRDEFHARPAAPVARWDDGSGIIAGRDLQSGGTWLGVSESGRFALVTNLRGYGAPDPARTSRGALVTDLLPGRGRYGDPATAALEDFNPFNLLLADGATAMFLTNRPEPLRIQLAHGIYGLSNGALDEPWHKTMALKEALLDWLIAGTTDVDPLFASLRSEKLPGVGVTPRAPSDVSFEPRDTPPFIHDPVYGTRCSTVVLIDDSGSGTIAERRFDAKGKQTGETTLGFERRALALRAAGG